MAELAAHLDSTGYSGLRSRLLQRASRIAVGAVIVAIAVGPAGLLDWFGVDPICSCPERIFDLVDEWRQWLRQERTRAGCEWAWATMAQAATLRWPQDVALLRNGLTNGQPQLMAWHRGEEQLPS
ncbi:hypothetical protein MKK88_13270 [Methylobacterium sp. E-005]|uniref:hypothetical protein n=1 Tax=Methylobacterium sp. E-005 TaxID=2836549 RepID=UPI001FB89FA3|nr:hypothetical protein [Methylobacterium sp. E-005]MCJ2086952.1 hypothetical protein [Methylobacterium sp. E-005]